MAFAFTAKEIATGAFQGIIEFDKAETEAPIGTGDFAAVCATFRTVSRACLCGIAQRVRFARSFVSKGQETTKWHGS